MLQSIKNLRGYTIRAKDGDIGKIIDFYFDDERWGIRYLAVDTTKWLLGKKVLISPECFYEQPYWHKREFPVILTKEMVKNSPDIDTDMPISRQKELEMLTYYRWPVYWGVMGANLTGVSKAAVETIPRISTRKGEASHLRSVKKITGYIIRATNGVIGHIQDFIVNDENWNICYLVVDKQNLLPGKSVLISPSWIKGISWEGCKLIVDHTKEEIKNSPPYDPHAPVNRKYEEKLYDYYGRSR